MATLIWFIIWWQHGFPNIVDHWNPWLIWLLICILLIDGSSAYGVRRS